MSQQGPMLSPFEEQFQYFVRQGGTQIKSASDSYNLDLLGFAGAIPMLTDPSLQDCDSLQTETEIECNVVEVHAEEPQDQQGSVEVSEVSGSEPKSQPVDASQPVPVQLLGASPSRDSGGESLKPIKTESHKSLSPVKNDSSSPLQGKRVIIRTNSMSGQKSLIFKQKTGENVEIPAKFSTFVDGGIQIKKEIIPMSLGEQVHPSNVAHVVFPQPEPPRRKPGILRRLSRCALQNTGDVGAEQDIKVDIKTEDESIFVEDANGLPFDHDYLNFPVKMNEEEECVGGSGPDVVDLSPKAHEVIEIDDDEDTAQMRIIPQKNVRKYPAQGAGSKSLLDEEGLKQDFVAIEGAFDKFQGLQSSEETKTQEKQPEERFLGKLGKINEHYMKKLTPVTNYEIVNTNLLRKGKELGDKSRYIVMIAKKESKESVSILKPVNLKPVKISKDKVVQPSFKIPFRPKMREHKKIQTDEGSVVPTRNAETNTDDDLLEELIEKRIQERALQNKVSKTTNTEEPQIDERIGVIPSPLLLCDPSDILEYLDTPNLSHIIGENADFGTGPMMGQINPSFAGKSMNNGLTNGKSIESCVGTNIMDISYTRGKNICNESWGGPEMQRSVVNTWPVQPVDQVGQNGRPRVEPWKLQLFIDLKNCDQFDSSGNMPIHNAVIQNNVTLVRRQCLALRTRQIDINTLNHNSVTPLQLALLHDASVAIVQLLLQCGADTSVLDSQGSNVLHICVTHSSEAVMKALLKSTVCADINGINFEGYTPLIICAMYKKYVKADDLLSAGADPNLGDKKSGRTPLFHAVEVNDVEMVKLLLNYKAQTKLRNFFGTSPHDAMFELDTVDPVIRKMILNKDEAASNQQKPPEVKRRRKRRPSSDDQMYSVRPYHPKKAKVSRS